MNILFGLNQSSDNTIEEKILETYKEKTGETFTYKKEFDVTGITKELFFNKYDILILSELLERNNTITTDFIDDITDKYPNLRIILIVDSEEHDKDAYIKKLFNIGVYDIVYSDEISIEILVELIEKPRTKMEAKVYLDLDDIEDVVVENELKYIPSKELENILSYLDSAEETSIVPTFRHIYNLYNEDQMIYLLDYLPERVLIALNNDELYNELCLKKREKAKSEIKEPSSQPATSSPATKKSSIFSSLKGSTEVKVIQKKETLIQNNIIGSVFIGVANSIRGAGSTFISVALASYLKNITKDVAIVEMNPNPFFANLSSDKTQKMIKLNGIDIYYMAKRPYKDDFPIPILSRTYKYLIMDLGMLKRIEDNMYKNNQNYFEFTRCTLPIMMVSGSEWKWGEIFPFLYDENIANWTIFVSPTSDKVKKTIQKDLSQYSKKIYFLPYTSDPFEPSEELCSVFEESLGEFVTKDSKRKAFGLPKINFKMPKIKNMLNVPKED